MCAMCACFFMSERILGCDFDVVSVCELYVVERIRNQGALVAIERK